MTLAGGCRASQSVADGFAKTAKRDGGNSDADDVVTIGAAQHVEKIGCRFPEVA